MGRGKRGSPKAYVRSIIINELLREVVHYAFDAAANTFRAIGLATSEFTANLMAFALGT